VGADGFYSATIRRALPVRFPKAGSVLELADVIPMNIRGQASPGTARTRHHRGHHPATKAEREAGGKHKVTIFKFTP
jgi:hypothetical protein